MGYSADSSIVGISRYVKRCHGRGAMHTDATHVGFQGLTDTHSRRSGFSGISNGRTIKSSSILNAHRSVMDISGTTRHVGVPLLTATPVHSTVIHRHLSSMSLLIVRCWTRTDSRPPLNQNLRRHSPRLRLSRSVQNNDHAACETVVGTAQLPVCPWQSAIRSTGDYFTTSEGHQRSITDHCLRDQETRSSITPPHRDLMLGRMPISLMQRALWCRDVWASNGL